MTNRRAADKLADIRAQIAVLREEEESLRRGFISGALPLEGDEHVVVLETKVNERINGRSMRANVDEAIWRPYLVSTETSYVTVRRRNLNQGRPVQ